MMVPVIVFAALWYLLIEELSGYWATLPEYSFGWFVPVCSAYLILIRWISRPPVDIPRSLAARWIFWVAGFAVLPTWVIGQASPDWRLIAWGLTIETVALSLAAIYLAGGKVLAQTLWLQRVPDFGGGAVAEPLVQGLTKASTVVTVAALNLFQINAVQHGNLVELKTGCIGIDEACSGIRSLQAALMMSLFLGELYRTSVRRRFGLVVCAVVIAFLYNAARTFFVDRDCRQTRGPGNGELA